MEIPSRNGRSAYMDGFFFWKSHLEMDDDWGPPHDETDHPPDGDTVTEVKGQNVPTAAIVSAAGGITDALVSIINTSLVAWADGSTSK